MRIFLKAGELFKKDYMGQLPSPLATYLPNNILLLNGKKRLLAFFLVYITIPMKLRLFGDDSGSELIIILLYVALINISEDETRFIAQSFYWTRSKRFSRNKPPHFHKNLLTNVTCCFNHSIIMTPDISALSALVHRR